MFDRRTPSVFARIPSTARAGQLLIACSLLLAISCALNADEPETDFSQDILPILSNNCFKCHGPDESNREAGLRLDQREAAMGKLDSGATAIIPGKTDRSALFERISSNDPDVQMPPPDSGKTLTPAQIGRIKRWIEDGAKWSGHWAF